MTLRTKIEEAIGERHVHNISNEQLLERVITIFREEIDQKFRKHRVPTNCSWAMTVKEQIQFDEEHGLYWDNTGTGKDGESFTKEDLLALILLARLRR